MGVGEVGWVAGFSNIKDGQGQSLKEGMNIQILAVEKICDG